MRCSICLEEMDHPANRTFSCPRKVETWHNKQYRKLLQEKDEFARLSEYKEDLTLQSYYARARDERIEQLCKMRPELRECEYPECWAVFKPDKYGIPYYCLDHKNAGTEQPIRGRHADITVWDDAA